MLKVWKIVNYDFDYMIHKGAILEFKNRRSSIFSGEMMN
jgi:hypothetical protein